ncbi:hypothetical protein DH2020_017485 [Rehmannia glutinosa]|uniref:Uncharacterized protein n=1 Tax=Rehmannia glutinosa TaxID=99300 RepID=A0ABR0WRW5_REHGL
MAFSSSRVLFVPLYPSSSFPFKPSVTAFPKLPLYHTKSPHFLLSASSSDNQPLSPFTSEQAVLETIANFDGTEKSLPAVRTYENDLARLTLVGAVDFKQALTAAAADGGEAADEHLSSGVSAMVVETLFPGPADDHSTILPSRKVKEKAIQLKKLLKKDFFSGDELSYSVSYQQVPVLLSLSSSDERIISEIGEVVCAAALEDTERHFLHDYTNRVSSMFFSRFNNQKKISSRESSVVLYNFLEHEIIANAKILLEKFNLERGKHKLKGTKLKNSWWTSTAFSKLKKIGGPEFCVWISEFIPAYMLEIDSNKFSDMRFEGWKKSDANRCEVVLTHSQMCRSSQIKYAALSFRLYNDHNLNNFAGREVSLADILDMYYEDVFTLPEKRLSCHAVAKPSNLDLNKGSSFFKKLSIVLVSGIFLVTISVLGKLYLPHLTIRKKYIQENSQAPFSEITCVPHHSVESSELEMCCVSIIRRIKDSFGWPGEIRKQSGVCAWIGELPNFLRKVDDIESNMLDISSTSIPLAASEEEMKSLEDIASYQVVVSTDWNIIGFQPTNRVAVNNWAANPLAKVLYGGKNLSPGLFEPGLKISHPSGVVVLELLISSNPNSYFAMVSWFLNCVVLEFALEALPAEIFAVPLRFFKYSFYMCRVALPVNLVETYSNETLAADAAD